MSSKRPSFQFYPADWVSNTKLQLCTFEEQAVWLRLLCLFHDSDEYGILRWTLKQMQQVIHCKMKSLQNLLKYGILKGSEKDGDKVSFSTTFQQRNAQPKTVLLIDSVSIPLYFSSRMVRDEYIRKNRAIHGSKSLENPAVPRSRKIDMDTLSNTDMDTLSGVDKDTFSPSPSSSSSKKEKDIAHFAQNAHQDFFDSFWKIYPRKKDRKRAEYFWAQNKLDSIADVLLADVQKRLQCDATWQEKQFIPYPLSYLKFQRWNDEITPIVLPGTSAPKTETKSTVPEFKPHEKLPERTPEQTENGIMQMAEIKQKLKGSVTH